MSEAGWQWQNSKGRIKREALAGAGWLGKNGWGRMVGDRMVADRINKQVRNCNNEG